MILPGLLSEIKNNITAKEDELARLGIDNRDVPNRKLNSRESKEHLGVRLLGDADDYDKLLAFDKHLGKLLKGAK